MKAAVLQQLVFEQIRAELPDNVSMAVTVAGLLDISMESAYRRIRGDIPLSFEEVQTLAEHFKKAFDTIYGSDRSAQRTLSPVRKK